jgi:hypothetical protein
LKKNEFNAREEFEKVLNLNQNKKSFLYSIISILNNPFNRYLELESEPFQNERKKLKTILTC